MTLTEFNEKVLALREKAGMDPDIQWPIVCDSDERGEILIGEDGAFSFADKRSNWIASHLSLADVENVRYKAQYGVSPIFVNFATGDSLEFRNMKLRSNRRQVMVELNIVKTDANAETAELLREKCSVELGSNKNAVYVKLQQA